MEQGDVWDGEVLACCRSSSRLLRSCGKGIKQARQPILEIRDGMISKSEETIERRKMVRFPTHAALSELRASIYA